MRQHLRDSADSDETKRIIVPGPGYTRSLLYTLRQMPWNSYDYCKLTQPTFLIYSDNDKVVKVDSDKIAHTESFAYSQYSHDEVANEKTAKLIIDFLKL